MSEQSFDVEVAATVRIVVRDPLVISRPVENTDGWRDDLYDLRTRDQVLQHLAFNAVANGRYNAHLMDGWADLAVDAVSMDVLDVEADTVYALAAPTETKGEA